MKKIIYLLITFLILNSIYSQSPFRQQCILSLKSNLTKIQKKELYSSNHPLIKSTTFHYENDSWVKSSEISYNYNTNNRISSIIEYRLSPRYNYFTLFSTENYVYNNLKPDLLEEKTSTRYFDWEEDPTIFNRTLYYYDENDSLNQIVDQSKADSNSTWVNNLRFVNIFDANGLLLQSSFDMWQDSLWVTMGSQFYTKYDINNNLLESVQKDFWLGEYIEKYKNIFQYDENNNKIRFLHQWMQESGWVNFSQNLYEYDEKSKITSDLFQHWNPNTEFWDNASKIEFAYNLNDNLFLTVSYRWDDYAQNPDWILTQRKNYKYQDGFKIEEMSEAFDGDWKKQSKTQYYYEGITDIEIIEDSVPEKFRLFQNYPNPFNPTTVIKYSIPDVGNENILSVQLKIYNVLGKEIKTLVNKEQSAGSYEVEFDAGDLTSGIYFYRIVADKYFETKKMILLR